MNDLRQHIPTLILLAIAALLSACNQPAGSDQAAGRLLEQYYQAIQAGTLDQAARLYPNPDQAQWLQFLQIHQERLGTLKGHQVDHMERNTVYSGVYYIFTVNGHYSKANTTEIVTIFEEIDQKHPWLNYHKITVDHSTATPPGPDSPESGNTGSNNHSQAP